MHQKALLCFGPPGTGKSVLLELHERLVGPENASAESLQKIEEDKYRSANLYGKRVNICSDIPSTKIHKGEVFKKLVSGIDTVDAENKYQQSFKFKNTAKLGFSANHLPEGPKDPAWYERLCLIECLNKFRGTEKEDKHLIDKLTTDTELSGFLNLALEGLKRLIENDKFSYNKTFEETEKEYSLNSNPVAFFIEERTERSTEDMDSTMLYLHYIDWSTQNKKDRVSNIEFSRKLSKMGYTNHRENEVNPITGKINNNKKVTLWDNIQLKHTTNIKKDVGITEDKKKLGQDLGQDETDRSCPNFLSQPITENFRKTVLGQDLNPFVDLGLKNKSLGTENIEEETASNMNYSEKKQNNRGTSCPKNVFPVTNALEYLFNDPVLDPVLSCPNSPKSTSLNQNVGSDSEENITTSELLRRDLKNYARSEYNSVIENVPVFVGDFNKKYPGFVNSLGLRAILDNAERLKKMGWK